MFRSTILAALCVAASSASADELDALQGGSVDLGAFRGIVYYTVEQEGYRVVATIAEGEEGLPVRFVTTLSDGQALAISVPGNLGEAGRLVEFERDGSRLLVSPDPDTDDFVSAIQQVTDE